MKKKSRKIALWAVMILCLLIAGILLYSLPAIARDSGGSMDRMEYSQQQLVTLLRQSSSGTFPEMNESDFTPLENPAIFGVQEGQQQEEIYIADGVSLQAEQAAWVLEQLEGKRFLELQKSDDAIHFVAMDLNSLELCVVSVNLQAQQHTITAKIEKSENMTAQADVYSFAPVIEERTEEPLAEQGGGQEPQTPEEPEGAEQPTQPDAPQEPQQPETPQEPENPQTPQEPLEPEIPQEPENEGQSPDASEAGVFSFIPSQETVNLGFPQLSIGINPASFSFPKVSDNQDSAIVSPTSEALPDGQQEEGREPSQASSEEQSDIEGKEETTAPSETIAEKWIVGFSLEEVSSVGQENIKAGAVMVLPPNGVGVLKIYTGLLDGGSLSPNPRMRSSIGGVTLLANRSLARSSSNGHGTLEIYSAGDTTVRGIQGPRHDFATYSNDGHVIAYSLDKQQSISIAGHANGQSGDFYINLYNTDPVELYSINGLAMDKSDDQLIIAGSTDSLLKITNQNGTGIQFGNNGSIVDATVEIQAENGFEAAESISLHNADVSVRAAQSPIVVENLEVNGSLVVDGQNTAKVGINATVELYVHDNALVHSYNSETAISAGSLVVYGGSQTYIAEKDVLSAEDKTRVVGFGTKIGIAVTKTGSGNGFFAGTGSVVYGKGEIGMQVSRIVGNYDTSDFGGNGTVDENKSQNSISKNNALGRPEMYASFGNCQFSTIYAVGSDIGMHSPPRSISANSQLVVAYKTRLVAVGGRYGILNESPGHAGADIGAYVYAIGGTEAGIASTSSRQTVRVWHAAKVYAKGGKYGALSATGAISVGSYGTSGDMWKWGRDPANGGGILVAVGGVKDEYMAGFLPQGMKDTTANRLPYDPGFDLLQEHMNYEPQQMPRPQLQDDTPQGKQTLVQPYDPSLAGTSGVRAGFEKSSTYALVASYDLEHKIVAYGGEYGAFAADTYVVAYEGGFLQGIGGRIGVSANSYVHCWSGGMSPTSYLFGNSTLIGIGKEIGILANAYLTTLSSGSDAASYVYGYGETCGIQVKGALRAYSGGTVVAETLVMPVDPQDPDNPTVTQAMKTPSIVAGTQNTHADSFIHEVYTIVWWGDNYNTAGIITPPPYELNRLVPAFSKQMGTNTGNLYKYNWTTPEYHPNRQEDGQHYKDYDPDDDQKLLKVTTRNGVTGLTAFASLEKVTIQAQTTGSCSDISGGLVGGSGKHRVTILEARIRDIRTMDVNINMRENNLPGGPFTVKNLNGATEYLVEFVPEYPDPFVGPNNNGKDDEGNWIDVGDSSSINSTTEVNPPYAPKAVNIKDGTIHLKKLRMGRYKLTPIVQVGYPFEDAQAIEFVLQVDKSSPDPNNWIESLFFERVDADGNLVLGSDGKPVYTNHTVEPGKEVTDSFARKVTEITEKSKSYGSSNPPEGQGTATIVPVSSDHNKVSLTYANFDWFLARIKYSEGLDFALIDAETKPMPWEEQYRLPGGFSLNAYFPASNPDIPGPGNSALIPGLAQTLQDTQDPAAWGTKIDVYAGLEYTFIQNTSLKEWYKMAPAALNNYKVRIWENWDYTTPETPVFKNHEIIQLSNASGIDNYWHSASETGKTPPYFVRAMNDQSSMEAKLHLIDEKLYLANSTSGQSVLESLEGLHIAEGSFELWATYPNGKSQDISATALQDNGDGTFTITLRPNRDGFELKQKTSDSLHEVRTDSSKFLVSVTYSADHSQITAFEIQNKDNPLPENSGWIEPVSWDKNSIWITNPLIKVPFSLYKVDKSGNPLADATFELYYCPKSHNPSHTHSDIANEKSCWQVSLAYNRTSAEGTGLMDFGMIEVGDYAVAEIKAPDGFSLPGGQWMLHVTSTEISVSTMPGNKMTPPAFKKRGDNFTFEVANYRLSELPKAGGINKGIITLTITGVLIMVAGIILATFRTKKRLVRIAQLQQKRSVVEHTQTQDE